ncbi:hypothetical protein HMPREF9442_01128 [Paraprevotella xylaniphila YIT 11841]|uniref:Uncharacterized protein n=1 Tax=Paraprevotella xylaniphila YIT 11841 TaxID=762982 RepID=F3QSH0_9BACT|nr:hypothetical protein HMPREF9442_01128 [Paraprevotella xylaniphila YIT 11841]
MFQASFSHGSFQPAQIDEPFGAERKIAWLRLKNHLAQIFLSVSAMKED